MGEGANYAGRSTAAGIAGSPGVASGTPRAAVRLFEPHAGRRASL